MQSEKERQSRLGTTVTQELHAGLLECGEIDQSNFLECRGPELLAERKAQRFPQSIPGIILRLSCTMLTGRQHCSGHKIAHSAAQQSLPFRAAHVIRCWSSRCKVDDAAVVQR